MQAYGMYGDSPTFEKDRQEGEIKVLRHRIGLKRASPRRIQRRKERLTLLLQKRGEASREEPTPFHKGCGQEMHPSGAGTPLLVCADPAHRGVYYPLSDEVEWKVP